MINHRLCSDEITQRAVAYKLLLIVDDRTIDLWAYNHETLLVEKLETIMVRAETNTRMRDFEFKVSGTNKLFWEIARFKHRFTRQALNSRMRSWRSL